MLKSNERGLSLNDIYRLGTLNRWQIVDTSRQQNVAEHMYFVSIITMELCKYLEITQKHDILRYVRWALMHDVPEVLTGDLPTPIKKIIPAGKLKGIEAKSGGIYREYISTDRPYDDELLLHIVKIADLIEAREFLIRYGRGDHAGKVFDRIDAALTKYIITLDERHDSQYDGPTFSYAYGRVVESFEQEPFYLEHITGDFK